MDTKLRKSKQIRAIVYRAISFGLLIMTILSATTSYKALNEFFVNEHHQLFVGDVTGVTEFQEYIGKIYNDGMLAFAGIGDDEGHPLLDNGINSIRDQATIDFYNAISDSGNLLYYVYDHNYEEEEGEYGNALHTNFTSPIFSQYDRHLILPENVRLMFYQNGPDRKLVSCTLLDLAYTKYSYMPNARKAQELDFVLAVNDDPSASRKGKLAELTKTALEYRDQLWFMSGCVVALLISWCFCLATIKDGRVAKKNMTQMTEKVLLEIKLVILICIVVSLFPYILHPLTSKGEKAIVLVGVLAMCAYPVLLDFKTNGSKVLVNWLPMWAYRYMQDWGSKQPWKRRFEVYAGFTGAGAMLCALLDFVLVYAMRSAIKNVAGKNAVVQLMNEDYGRMLAVLWITFIGIVLLAACIYNGMRLLRETAEITDKLSDIRNGNLSEPLTAVPGAFLAKTVDDVNMLESGIENAVEQKSKADRMKVELITNVSHDLKTPLTSIINYVDLLCEEDMSPAARDYVNALRDKSYKLKAMVQDVFEVSKASTGNLTVENVVLDLGKLIKQTLADMDERIAESNLTFKLNLPEEPVYIEGDGEKLYRTFQNLFVNAIQYSLDYSRVHVSLAVKDGTACASVKNTSRGELNFDTLDITERFVRADASRTTEGSGLGLSIAKSFTEACGGEFGVEIDADMFAVTILLPVVDAPTVSEEPQENA